MAALMQLSENLLTLDNAAVNKIGEESESVEDLDYIIRTYLYGFNEDDIVVKIRHRVVFIEATHKENNDSTNGEIECQNYTSFFILPTIVAMDKGTWTYEDGNLSIRFPLNLEQRSTRASSTTDDIQTKIIPFNPKIDIRSLQEDLTSTY